MSDQLPGGVVTFMFTDIEGSTALFRRLGDEFPPLLEKHNELLRSVWVDHGGVEVKTEGDAFFVAFADPAAAVRAGVDGIERLRAHPWPPDAEIKVRIGMHTGVGYPRDWDYIAFPVHQAARIGAVGHGGQVIITPDTARLLPDMGDIKLHDLGAFRVRDFDDAVHLFQVERSSTPTEFAPLRAKTDADHNLPLDIPAAVGRVDDMAGIADQMSQSRVVTIVGPGGVGKTLVSLNLARDQHVGFSDGVWFVDLASHHDGTALRGAVADALQTTPDELSAHLETRQLLLVLDNAEQATAEIGTFVAHISANAADVSVLVTSREPLGIASERLWRLEPLDPDGASVELFAERARAVDPSFDLTAHRVIVAELCRRLDGLPLAIELAAARVTAMSVAEILESLTDRMRVLRSRRRDLDARQRTATGLVDWSYQLLDEDEQLVFRRLGVFAGHFGLDAATAASEDSGLDRIDVADIVWSLVEKSLVMPITADGVTRYRLLETLRAFGVQTMVETGELETVLSQVGHWYRTQFDPSGPITRSVATRIGDEITNLRQMASALADHDPGLGQWLAWTIGLHYKTVDPARGLTELEPIIESLTHEGEAVVAMLAMNAHLANSLNQLERAASIVDHGEGFIESAAGRPVGVGWLRNVAALNAIKTGRYDDARTIAAAEVDAATELERVSLLNTLGIVYAEQGELGAASEAFEEVLAIATRLGALDAEVVSVSSLGEIAHRAGDVPQACAHTIHAVRVCAELGLRSQSALAMVGAARLVAEAGEVAECVVIHTGADRMLIETGQTMFEGDRQISDAVLLQARTSLGDQRYAELAQQGSALEDHELVERSQSVLEATISALATT